MTYSSVWLPVWGRELLVEVELPDVVSLVEKESRLLRLSFEEEVELYLKLKAGEPVLLYHRLRRVPRSSPVLVNPLSLAEEWPRKVREAVFKEIGKRKDREFVLLSGKRLRKLPKNCVLERKSWSSLQAENLLSG